MYNQSFMRKSAPAVVLLALIWFLLFKMGVAHSAGDDKQASETIEYAISGRITQGFSNEPFPGVVIVASSGVTTTTDSEGTFRLDLLPEGSYTITPTMTADGHQLLVLPISRTIDLPPDAAGQDFAAQIVVSDAGVAGQVTHADGQPLLGATLHLSSGGAVQTDQEGRYLFFPVAPGEYTLWPQMDGYWFSPGRRTVYVPADPLGHDFVAGVEYVVVLPLILR